MDRRVGRADALRPTQLDASTQAHVAAVITDYRRQRSAGVLFDTKIRP
jgi:hypothetical protein